MTGADGSQAYVVMVAMPANASVLPQSQCGFSCVPVQGLSLPPSCAAPCDEFGWSFPPQGAVNPPECGWQQQQQEQQQRPTLLQQQSLQQQPQQQTLKQQPLQQQPLQLQSLQQQPLQPQPLLHQHQQEHQLPYVQEQQHKQEVVEQQHPHMQQVPQHQQQQNSHLNQHQQPRHPRKAEGHARSRGAHLVDGFSVKQLIAALAEGSKAQSVCLDLLLQPGVVRRLAFEAEGCRLVQLALEVADRHTATELADGLRGSVARLVLSPHGNYVIQKIIEVLTAQEVPFIVEELAEASLDLAQHEYGCRVYCRLLENAALDQHSQLLIDEVVADAECLVQHKYGHYVAECVVEHGLPRQQQRIIEALRQGLARNVQNRNAAYVIEKALLYAGREERERLAWDLLQMEPAHVVAIAGSPTGIGIARALLQQPTPIARKFQELLLHPTSQSRLCASKHGNRLLKQMLGDVPTV